MKLLLLLLLFFLIGCSMTSSEKSKVNLNKNNKISNVEFNINKKTGVNIND